jgi:hypothetical protein
VGAVVAGFADAFLLLVTTFLMAWSLLSAFEKWPQYWWLGVLLIVVSLVVIFGLAMTVLAAWEDSSSRVLSVAQLRRVSAYLLPPLVLSALISFAALVLALLVVGGIF